MHKIMEPINRIRPAILLRMKEKKLTNSFVCDKLKINRSSFSQFLHDKRSLPIQDIENILYFLELKIN